MKDSNIEWTHHTANLWMGCTKVHAGCDNCYAELLAKRTGRNIWGIDRPRMAVKSVWDDFKKYQKLAEREGSIHRVFVGSMMDIFEKPMPLTDHTSFLLGITTDAQRQQFFREVVPSSPNLQFLLLTKRPSNINKYIPESWKASPPENVLFGTSPVNPETFEKLVAQLKEVNGKRFLSIEPQLEAISLGKLEGIDWIIQGGESGVRKRPFDIAWARSMRDECKALGIPYFFKQIDKVQTIPVDMLVREFPAHHGDLAYQQSA